MAIKEINPVQGEPDRMDMGELLDYFEGLMKCDNINLDTESLRTPKIYFQVQRELVRQTKSLQFWYQSQAKLKERRRLYYDSRLPQSTYKDEPLRFPPKNQTELGECLKADSKMQDCELFVREAEMRVKVCEETLTQVKSRHWDIQNAIKYRAMMEGRA